jgi:hypothetical protein
MTIEYQSDPVDILVGRNGSAEPAKAQWSRSRETPNSWPLFHIEVVGPFGRVTATASDVFSALQDVRNQVEPEGWRFAVEGARPRSRAMGIHRDQGDGLIVVRLDERRGSTRGLFDPIELTESGTVAEQEAAFLDTQKTIRTQIIRDDWRSLESLRELATNWPSFQELPDDLKLKDVEPAIAALGPGWRGFRFSSTPGPGILAVAPPDTDWDAAVDAVRRGEFDLSVPSILLVVDGAFPDAIWRALERRDLEPSD